jgi:hypothetical protein
MVFVSDCKVCDNLDFKTDSDIVFSTISDLDQFAVNNRQPAEKTAVQQ